MHRCRNQPCRENTINGATIKSVYGQCSRSRGILRSADASSSRHCQQLAANTSKTAGQSGIRFIQEITNWQPAFYAVVLTANLDVAYCTRVRSSILKKEVECLEKILRRYADCNVKLRDLSYAACLKSLQTLVVQSTDILSQVTSNSQSRTQTHCLESLHADRLVLLCPYSNFSIK